MKSLDSIGRMASGRAEDMGNSSQKRQQVHVFQNLGMMYIKQLMVVWCIVIRRHEKQFTEKTSPCISEPRYDVY